MTTSIETDPSPGDRVGPQGMHWFSHGVANLAVILVLSLATWYLLVDPMWSPFGLYPQPFLALLFWALLSVVWVGFNLEFHAFDQLRQPWRGIALILVVAVIATVITLGFAQGWGRFDPTFASDRADGIGYLAGALWVLFGFFFYVMSVVNWGNWPWIKSGLRQPWLGFGQISMLILPTTVVYLALAVPSVADWGTDVAAALDTDTLIGWFYCLIISVVVTALLTENWPWRLAGTSGRVALTATVGNAALGTAIYFIFRPLTESLIGAANVSELGAAVTVFPAQLGVCWVFWMILWQNGFANKPDGFSAPARYALRVVITLALAIGTFLLYFYVIAGTVLHEPVMTSTLSGNALGWMDWLILWTLFYILCLQSWGLPKPAGSHAPAPEDVAAPAGVGEQAQHMPPQPASESAAPTA